MKIILLAINQSISDYRESNEFYTGKKLKRNVLVVKIRKFKLIIAFCQLNV